MCGPLQKGPIIQRHVLPYMVHYLENCECSLSHILCQDFQWHGCLAKKNQEFYRLVGHKEDLLPCP